MLGLASLCAATSPAMARMEVQVHEESQLQQERAECRLADRDVLHVQDELHVRSQQLNDLRESLEEKRQRLADCQLRRQELVRAYVGDLARDIFPICEEVHPQHIETSMEPSAPGGRELYELEEAQQTVYMRGRWVHLAPTEGCYNLVGVRLPTSGDYSQYCHWLAEQQERAWPAPEEPCNAGYTLSAGLMYAAQMVAVLAFYLDVPLPHSLCYSQFGARDESEEDFRNLVARLNSNVLHLCASQGLEPPLLRPRTTLRNLALLVQHQGSIRLGPFEMSNDLWASLEESLGPELQPSDPDSDDNDDWEDVTEDSPKADMQNDERGSGPSEVREFQAETRMLLDIVARSLYSEKEVFVRELVSNASDALERLRYMRLTEPDSLSAQSAEAPLEIHIATDKLAGTFTIQDTGIGMTREEVCA
ncbi:hypothetical protein HPB50_014197 [Hyalomma asiaticum]|uniref:Uncharacterized protein n=1 Tax=Hyalomma asiaticum TaxID=266040 RepID=A0ACB7RXF9_HYAAI|nr:hypothetical protein HPB50_014197 [Hyalomma asiaticum]